MTHALFKQIDLTAKLGQQLVRLGQAMQNPNTKLGELTELVQACGVDLRICDTNKESRS